MSEGTIVSIHIAREPAGPVEEVREARVIPGRGIEGDRYFDHSGTYSDLPGPARDITLIESEALQAFADEFGVKLAPGESRRNVTTSGVGLNDLLDREFTVGEVRLRGVKLSEPCAHLASLTHPDVVKGLAHRAGIRCEVLTEGVIRPGDPIRTA